MSRFARLRPMLRTWDFAATLDFYRSTLGFRCVAELPGEEWACLERDGVQIMISGPNDHLNETVARFTGSLYFDCDEVDDLFERLSRKGVEVCYPPETFHYGMREFAIYDNNGYLLQFGEEAE